MINDRERAIRLDQPWSSDIGHSLVIGHWLNGLEIRGFIRLDFKVYRKLFALVEVFHIEKKLQVQIDGSGPAKFHIAEVA